MVVIFNNFELSFQPGRSVNVLHRRAIFYIYHEHHYGGQSIIMVVRASLWWSEHHYGGQSISYGGQSISYGQSII